MYPVEVKNLSHAYDTIPILKGINLKIEKGSFSGIVGPNGSGKTTLVKNIMRSISPTRRLSFIGDGCSVYDSKRPCKGSWRSSTIECHRV